MRVHFEDTDLSGIVYHATYLSYCERGRSEILRQLDIDQAASFAAGEGVYAVAEAHLFYRRPARLNDALLIETRAIEMHRASLRLAQRVLRADEVLAEVTIRLAFIDPGGRPRAQPAHWRARFEAIFAREHP